MPFFVWLLVWEEDFLSAAVLLFVIGVPTRLDRRLAGPEARTGLGVGGRRSTRWPIAVFAAVVGGWFVGVIPPMLAAALVLRELVMAAAAILLTMRRGERVAVRPMGKWPLFSALWRHPAFYLAAVESFPGGLRTFFEVGAWIFCAIGWCSTTSWLSST